MTPWLASDLRIFSSHNTNSSRLKARRLTGNTQKVEFASLCPRGGYPAQIQPSGMGQQGNLSDFPQVPAKQLIVCKYKCCSIQWALISLLTLHLGLADQIRLKLRGRLLHWGKVVFLQGLVNSMGSLLCPHLLSLAHHLYFGACMHSCS